VANEGQGHVVRPQEGIVFHFPHYQSGNTPHSAIRIGTLKLIKMYEDDSVRLFDLDADIGERSDLAASRPADASRLRTRLERYLAAVDAQMPTPNPEFDPSQPAVVSKKNDKDGAKKKGGAMQGKGGKGSKKQTVPKNKQGAA
jgi:arylsulfatase A